jgi:hypothetical protein
MPILLPRIFAIEKMFESVKVFDDNDLMQYLNIPILIYLWSLLKENITTIPYVQLSYQM